MFYLPIRILTRPGEVLSQAHDYNIVCIRWCFLLQINIRSTTCLAWSLYDYRVRKMVGTIYFGTAIWRHLGGAGPNAPTCSFQLVPADFERAHCFTFACDGYPSGKARQTALPAANTSPQANESGPIDGRLRYPVGRRESRSVRVFESDLYSL